MTDQPMITGSVQTIIFENNENFFKIILVKITQKNINYADSEIVVTGSFGDLKEEGSYIFYGQLVTHPKYGQQFQATNYQTAQPTTTKGLVNYLSGDNFKGIGQKSAQEIVTKLGSDAIDKIIADQSVLEQVELSDKQKRTLITNLKLNNGMEQIIIGLNNYGFGSTLAYHIYQTYFEKTLDVIQENPYQLIKDIDGIGFTKADNIAQQLGFSADSTVRIKGAVLQAMTDLTISTGDTYTQAEQLLKQSLQLLQKARPIPINPDLIAEALMQMAKEGQIISDDNRIYLQALYQSELSIARQLQRIFKLNEKATFEAATIQKNIKVLEKRFGIQYDDSQKQAIQLAVEHGVFLLTGGPGTGKTTIINGIVALYAELYDFSLDTKDYKDKPFPILLAAPTGRAAKKMSETTGLPASTIHRLLGITGREQNTDLSSKELEGSLLIVDEMSMVDTYLFNTLLKAVPSSMKIILVGDKDQLPSVGPGQVFSDLLMSQCFPQVQLKQIHRQDDSSTIIDLAHDVNQGQLPQDLLKPQKDRSFIQCQPSQLASVIEQVVQKAKAKSFSVSDIQVLAPMYRGQAGIDTLNPMIQEIMNPPKNSRTKAVKFGSTVYRIGDKVLHLVNSPESNVFNGEIGQIVGITYAKESDDKVDELVIAFESTEVTYGRSQWSKITLAYCTSIHKAQGSEFKMVILPLVKQYSRMLQRNLLYTAITRAKDFLILVGEVGAFQMATESLALNRQTSLVARLTTTLKPQDKPIEKIETDSIVDTDSYVLTTALINSQKIDPMIGMSELLPKDFIKKTI